MKKLVMVATITASLIGLSACSGDDAEVVVETNEGNITKDAFYEELKATAGESVLQNMVLKTILESKYEIDESAIEDQMNMYREQYGDMFEMLLQQQGIASEAAFEEQLRMQMLQQKALSDGVEVTDEEIEAQYNRMINEVQASHILVEDEELANELYERATSGEDFAALAEEYSTDSGSAVEGGSVGYFSRGQMVPAFEDKAYELEIGDISEPVQSEYGYHIIYVTDKRPVETDVEALEDVRDQLESEIAATKVDSTQAQEKITQLLKDADIDVLVEEFEDTFVFEDPAADLEENVDVEEDADADTDETDDTTDESAE
ncbi:foldase protein PrsA [Halolactibacillus halophilus]|uniref:Foldase protein PrsA n=1 Tax=Halolactibacillus halophilus TaxID=306540 RepID=A0A1I5PKV9_9BACI|nr:peptidylprolyl isomerase [Halolactibacillus halophilus]GEM02546.1 foldase protein PrsA [Halolactibacillus halophilus]SFP34663.1 foldase protein PrsA [Halolactibacillus halophilus]